MAILQIDSITKYFGDLLLFENLSLIVNKGEKIALVAKNGAGKTTLIKIILGLETSSQGVVFIDSNTSVGYLDQNPEFSSQNSIYDEVYYSFSELVETKQAYNSALNLHDDNLLQKLTDQMDALQAWDYDSRVEFILSKMEFTNTKQIINTLSGGQKKRVALAKLLLRSPDFIILDEPTNHLDLDIIEWLESYLSSMNNTLLMVTHDRYFLDRVCNTIIEIDNQQAFKYDGNYSYFIEKKEEREIQQSAEISKAKNLLRTELDWMRRQPQARGTKAKYRIDAFYELEEKANQSQKKDSLDIMLKGKRLGNKVIELTNISKAYGEKKLIDSFSYIFHRNEKIGIIGSNGCGKSTFLNIVTEQIKPDSGFLDYGETVLVGYYKQDGLLLKEDCKVIDVIKEIAETIEIQKGKFISATQFLEQWLFPRSMHYMYVSRLSGGEKKRLYLMTVLMKQPNFLILDEPTNDLDLYTLHILEDYLSMFDGCVVIVSHDRFFTDKVVDHMFVFKGKGIIQDFPGNYSLYRDSELLKQANESKQNSNEKQAQIEKKPDKKGLNFKEKQELQQLEKDIKLLETEKTEIETLLHSGNLSTDDLMKYSQRIGVILVEIDTKEMRWLELSEN